MAMALIEVLIVLLVWYKLMDFLCEVVWSVNKIYKSGYDGYRAYKIHKARMYTGRRYSGRRVSNRNRNSITITKDKKGGGDFEYGMFYKAM